VDGAILFAGYRLMAQTWEGLSDAFTHNAGSFVACLLLLRIGVTALTGLAPRNAWVDGRRLATDGSLLLQTWLAPKGVIGFAGDPSWRDALRWLAPSATTTESALSSPPSQSEMASASFNQLQARLRAPLRP
jgi:hypothetical protein